MTVATFAAEPLSRLPGPYPAVLMVTRTVSPQALVAFEGNYYWWAQGIATGRSPSGRVLGAEVIDVVTAAGNTLARHRGELRGAHAIVRASEHVAALEKAVLAASSDTSAPHRRKQRIPPSAQARAEADRVRAALTGAPPPSEACPVDFGDAAAARPLGADHGERGCHPQHWRRRLIHPAGAAARAPLLPRPARRVTPAGSTNHEGFNHVHAHHRHLEVRRCPARSWKSCTHEWLRSHLAFLKMTAAAEASPSTRRRPPRAGRPSWT